MAEQLVLLTVAGRTRRPRRAAPYRVHAAPSGAEWQLDGHTVAVGRRSLAEARRALRRTARSAA